MPPLAVTDAHALIWAATGEHRKLGTKARRMYERVETGKAAIYVPASAVVEIGEAVLYGEVSFPMGFPRWIASLFSTGKYHHVDLTLQIILEAERLYGIPERSDRLIAATARVLECPLLTRNPEITRVGGIEYLW